MPSEHIAGITIGAVCAVGISLIAGFFIAKKVLVSSAGAVATSGTPASYPPQQSSQIGQQQQQGPSSQRRPSAKDPQNQEQDSADVLNKPAERATNRLKVEEIAEDL